MAGSSLYAWLSLFAIITCIKLVTADDIVGCQGFIVKNGEIDFSRVEIKLYTKQGSLKDTTDCSPSNGYFFLPIYDKGDYVLKVAPPPGWSFEPEEVAIRFDGKTDVCSLGKDVNFEFKGFGITGRVGVLGQKTGAAGVSVSLTPRNPAENDGVRRTQTDNMGVFSFTPVIPGAYSVKLEHERWHFERDTLNVQVTVGNTELEDNLLMVNGFNVHGRVQSDGKAFPNVGLALFPHPSNVAAKGFKCTLTGTVPVSADDKQYNGQAVCSSRTTSDGSFTFPALAPGKYLIRPYFDNVALKYNVEPREQVVEVVRDTLTMATAFDVTGFSISGRVLVAVNGQGVKGASLKLNGQRLAETNAEGIYSLDNVKAGTYTIQVTADGMQFTDHTVKITAANPHIPDIIVSAFKVCGSVASPKSQTISITKLSSTFHIQVTSADDGTGKWCTHLPNGQFMLEVQTTAEEQQQGVQFYPLQHKMEVNSKVIDGITFSQLKATVTGSVNYRPDAGSMATETRVTMKALDGTERQYVEMVGGPKNEYKFKDVLPGRYEVLIACSQCCWESQRQQIEVKRAEETVPVFTQTGYLIQLIASHSTRMLYGLKATEAENAKQEDTFELANGLNTLCVPNTGIYSIRFEGCHNGEQLINEMRTGSKSPFTITFDRHRNGIRVVADSRDAFEMAIERNGQKTVVKMAENQRQSNANSHVFEYHFEMRDQEVIKLLPSSDISIFEPATHDLIGARDCVEEAFTFKARKGLIINGGTEPRIADALIKLQLSTGQQYETRTDAKGGFKFGPIDTAASYELTAAKESYVFGPFNAKTSTFAAHKLCEIIVTVRDEAGQLLSGVLLSLSGAESYRKNLVTPNDGKINFHTLSPSKYFLKPMMKEYKFDPTSKMIDLKDGETVNLELIAKRYAYSVLGQVTSLNGDPFANVMLEAVANEPCEAHQEEANTEANGQYRIRGLQPGCEYTVRMKWTEAGNRQLVDRAIPKERVISVTNTDALDVNFIAMSPIGFVDVTSRIMAVASNEHYKTLRIAMYRKGQNDNPIYSNRVESPLNVKSKVNPGIMVFFPRIPLDGKTYVIELTTTMSAKNFDYQLPSFQFQANRSTVFTEFYFDPVMKTADAELNQNSVLALILIALVAFAFLKQELFLELTSCASGKVMDVVRELVEKNRTRSSQREAAATSAAATMDIDSLAKSINDVRKRKPKKAM